MPIMAIRAWARQGRRLVPAFFSRFFETELTTGADDLKLAFFALLAVLAVPGFALPLLLASASAPIPAESGFGTDPAGWGWSMIAHYQGPEALRLISRPDKVFYLGFAMIASAIVSLITWNTLLLDRRDRIVLGPLPLPAAAVVLAKLAALLGYIGLVALAMHALASVAFGVALAANNTIIFAFRGIAAHLIASVAASLFVMLAVVALQGLTLALLAPRWFARVSPALQLAVVCLVITGVLTLPALTQSVNGAVTTAGGPDAWILATPPLWFLGLYERVLGTTNPALLGLSRTAQVAMALVSVTAIASFLVASGRAHVANTGRHVIQVRRSAVAIRALATAMGRDPQFQAAARFVLTTIARSHRHRLVMASAIGAATAWGLPGVDLAVGPQRSTTACAAVLGAGGAALPADWAGRLRLDADRAESRLGVRARIHSALDGAPRARADDGRLCDCPARPRVFADLLVAVGHPGGRASCTVCVGGWNLARTSAALEWQRRSLHASMESRDAAAAPFLAGVPGGSVDARPRPGRSRAAAASEANRVRVRGGVHVRARLPRSRQLVRTAARVVGRAGRRARRRRSCGTASCPVCIS